MLTRELKRVINNISKVIDKIYEGNKAYQVYLFLMASLAFSLQKRGIETQDHYFYTWIVLKIITRTNTHYIR